MGHAAEPGPGGEREMNGDCNRCDLWVNWFSGVPSCPIPDGEGRCRRDGGHCDPYAVRDRYGREHVRKPDDYRRIIRRRTHGG